MSKIQRRLRKYRTSLKRLPAKFDTLVWRVKRFTSGENLSSVAFRVDGGMGDHVMAARFIRDFAHEIPGLQFDIYCKRPKIMQWLLKEVSGTNMVGDKNMDLKILRNGYHYIFNVFTFVSVAHERKGHKSGKAAPSAELLSLEKIAKRIKESGKPIGPQIDRHPLLDGYLGQYAVMKGSNRHRYLHQMAGIGYGGDELAIETDAGLLQKHQLTPQRYITLSNGYDEQVELKGARINTKVFPHFSVLARLIKDQMPDVTLVQIGSTTSTPMDAVDIDLIGKTTLPEVAGLLQHALLHIDNEGGLVHLASALGTRSCVIFGPTLAEYFGYETNLNIPPEICGSCWWMEPTWMTTCVKGHEKPLCMYTHNPHKIADQILSLLDPARQHAVQPARIAAQEQTIQFIAQQT